MWTMVLAQMTALDCPRSATPVNAASQGMQNKSARGNIPVKATTTVKSSTHEKAFKAANGNSSVKARLSVKPEKPVKNTEVE